MFQRKASLLTIKMRKLLETKDAVIVEEEIDMNTLQECIGKAVRVVIEDRISPVSEGTLLYVDSHWVQILEFKTNCKATFPAVKVIRWEELMKR